MTRQASDILIFEKNEYYLDYYILEEYFRKNPNKRPENNWVSTGLHRQYYAKFEIKDNQLFVLNDDYLLADLFPNNGKLFWYSGLIRIDDFKGEFYLEPKNGIFEYLEIVNGNFIGKRVFNYIELQKFKKEQFEYFLISDEINDIYEFWRNENGKLNKESVNNIILERIMEYTKLIYVN